MSSTAASLTTFADVEAFVRSMFAKIGTASVTSEFADDELRMTITASTQHVDRCVVLWRVLPGLEVFMFEFDGTFHAVDFDYDVAPGDKAKLVSDWVRLIESYFCGGGQLTEKRTMFRRRKVQHLQLE
ncbi:hypothetical protein [Aeromicrobium sp.]|uniref:hypothetical protein n=1 Tax=Aeromicrobium sp. TaxID=1871063 RepID=UPI0019B03D0F|nr:hypothetical protein [Aeromicrobium sp.]MBC7631405.1 hypothetical protein [Aeromicrobium sp.]